MLDKSFLHLIRLFIDLKLFINVYCHCFFLQFLQYQHIFNLNSTIIYFDYIIVIIWAWSCAFLSLFLVIWIYYLFAIFNWCIVACIICTAYSRNQFNHNAFHAKTTIYIVFKHNRTDGKNQKSQRKKKSIRVQGMDKE